MLPAFPAASQSLDDKCPALVRKTIQSGYSVLPWDNPPGLACTECQRESDATGRGAADATS
jgi:hypothetical protein